MPERLNFFSASLRNGEAKLYNAKGTVQENFPPKMQFILMGGCASRHNFPLRKFLLINELNCSAAAREPKEFAAHSRALKFISPKTQGQSKKFLQSKKMLHSSAKKFCKNSLDRLFSTLYLIKCKIYNENARRGLKTTHKSRYSPRRVVLFEDW
ncbi:MAG: hypothetical protein AMS15_03655 [Planctomycetes bacterium DG_23]|nr:MAG: hypothetical protein AMS15_03655 [Planctomycetes bacterium DG_23]